MRYLNSGSLVCLILLTLFGCANDFEYRFVNPETCIEVSKTPTTCTEDQAKANRAKLFAECKAMNGTPAIRAHNPFVTRIYGVDCLMPDGSIKDLYGEKFKRDTGQDLYN